MPPIFLFFFLTIAALYNSPLGIQKVFASLPDFYDLLVAMKQHTDEKNLSRIFLTVSALTRIW